MKVSKTIILFLFIGLVQCSFAQTEASIDKDTILIGDQFKLKLDVSLPKGNTIVWPLLKDTLTNQIEIISKSNIDTLNTKDGSLLSQELILTSFDTGQLTIPQLKFTLVNQKSSEVDILFSQALSIQVNTVTVDTSQAIMPIKGPISSPYTFPELAPFIFGGLALIAIIIFSIIYYRRLKQKKPIIKRRLKPRIAAHILALNNLKELKSKKLWQDGKFKVYYTELTDIIRIYLDERYQIEAMEMTSDEILALVTPHESIDSKLKDKLAATLMTADLVKFAKQKPIGLENDNNLSDMIEFVKGTKRVEEVKVQEEQQKESITNDKVNEDVK